MNVNTTDEWHVLAAQIAYCPWMMISEITGISLQHTLLSTFKIKQSFQKW